MEKKKEQLFLSESFKKISTTGTYPLGPFVFFLSTC